MRFLSFIFLIGSTISQLQAQTSIADGNWTMPFTWDCTCVPLPGSTVTVAHNVILNTDWATSNGSITVNSGASLMQDATARDILLSGGFITNNGAVDLNFLSVQTGTLTNNGLFTAASLYNLSTVNNTGDLTGLDSLYTDGDLTNSGVIDVATLYNADQMDNQGQIINLDSMYNAGTMVNTAGATVQADSATNEGTLTNNGSFSHIAMTNSGTYTNNGHIGLAYFTNLGTFHNNDSIIGTESMTNAGSFINHENAAVILNTSFLNANAVTHNASFENNGFLSVGDSWYNFDAFSGNANGRVEVQDTSANMGSMTGNFDLCDLSPNTIVPPQSPSTGLDYNIGTVGGNITWCVLTGIVTRETTMHRAYPNPANEQLVIEDWNANMKVRLYDLSGRLVVSSMAQGRIITEGLVQGVYLLIIEENGPVSRQKVSIVH